MLFRSYGANSGAVKLNLQIDPIHLNIDTAIPIGLLLYELVSNSLKYAFPDGRKGIITIEFSRIPERRYLLSFRDDGIGLPREFDLDNATSLGLRLVKILANQIGGQLTLLRNEGTAFTVNFEENRVKQKQ